MPETAAARRATPAKSARCVPALLAALLLLAAGPAAAWGKLGHRLVATLAAEELSPAARAEAARLMAGEPEPTLAGISTWADQLRDSDPGLGRRSAPWHYVNLGEHGCRYDAAAACPGGDCVVEAIRTQAAILADRTRSDADRLQALKFVVHFVADVHQPLHAGFARDKGGNTIQVRLPERFIPPYARGNPGSNLHSVWDGGLLHSAGLDEAAYLAQLRTMDLAVRVPAPALPPAADEWAGESCAIVLRDGFMPSNPSLGEVYYADWRPMAEERVRVAASRLATVLDAALAAD
jgi:hypothetical protein